MSSKNSQIIIGNLGADAKVRLFEQDRGQASFRIATSKTYKNRQGEMVTQTQWHNVVSWDPQVIAIAERSLKTGRQVLVEGEATTRSYQDREDRTQYIREIRANTVQLIDDLGQPGQEVQSLLYSTAVARLKEAPAPLQGGMPAACLLQLAMEEAGEAYSLPIHVYGPQASFSMNYLQAGSPVCVTFRITSTEPFKAVAIHVGLLGRSQEGSERGNGPVEEISRDIDPPF